MLESHHTSLDQTVEPHPTQPGNPLAMASGVDPPAPLLVDPNHPSRRYYRPGQQPQNGNTPSTSSATSGKQGGSTYHSFVWQYFLLYDDERNGTKRTYAQCTICSNSIQYTRNTSNMLRHLSGAHANIYTAARAESGATPPRPRKRKTHQAAGTPPYPPPPPSHPHTDPYPHPNPDLPTSDRNDTLFYPTTNPTAPPPADPSPTHNPAPPSAAATTAVADALGGGRSDDWLVVRPTLRGFGNEFESEALRGATAPRGRNNPLRPLYGLYTEQISGSPFTTPRSRGTNYRTWMYRRMPSAAACGRMARGPEGLAEGLAGWRFRPTELTPERLRWKRLAIPVEGQVDFVDGMVTVAGCGDPMQRNGLRIYVYAFNTSMRRRCYYSADGDVLLVPQEGTLFIKTELGRFHCPPGHIAVIPQGIKYAVGCDEQVGARGYALEVFGGHFELPDLGPIGANGLASPRDFETPSAWFEECASASSAEASALLEERALESPPYELVTKFGGEIFTSHMVDSPFDVVAWHGNYVPFAYDLALFSPVNSVLIDHADPSIFTVLTCKGQCSSPGMALADFVIFPPRWIVAEDTFRPPYFHRNCMSEFMGVIRGRYDAKSSEEFGPGASTLHQMMSPHGPDAASYANAFESRVSTNPVRIPDTDLAFMFESSQMLKLTPWALETECRDANYTDCWRDIPYANISS